VSLLSLIQGASESMGTKMASIRDAASGIYESSPLGKIEEGLNTLEDKFEKSALHQAFAGGQYGSGTHGSSNFGQAGLSAAPSNYIDATSELQSIMTQGGIMNPAVSQLKAGGPAANVSAAPLSGYDTPIDTTPVNPYEGEADVLDDPPALVETMQADVAVETTPLLLEKGEEYDDQDKLDNGILSEK